MLLSRFISEQINHLATTSAKIRNGAFGRRLSVTLLYLNIFDVDPTIDQPTNMYLFDLAGWREYNRTAFTC